MTTTACMKFKRKEVKKHKQNNRRIILKSFLVFRKSRFQLNSMKEMEGK